MIADAARRPSRRTRGIGDVASVASFLERLDWVLMLAVSALVAYGLWAISGITRFDVTGDPDYYVRRQAIAAGLGAVAMLAILAVPLDMLRRSWKVVYLGTIGLMLVVFALAETVRGSRRWIDIGPLQFQPSELGKVFFVLALAGFLCDRQRSITRLGTPLAAIGLASIPMVLVFLQPDLGTALVYLSALAAVLFLGGVRWLHLGLLGATAVTVVVSVVWLLPAAGIEVLKPYQTARLTGFTNPSADPDDLNYNVAQSTISVGSGGLSGRGVTDATQTRLDYLPEHHTDFAFASLAEQRGFFGAAVLLLLYLLVVWRGLRIVTVAGDLFGAIVAGSIVFAFLMQTFINVGMTMGIAPVTGIPLAYVTVGGSSVIANLMAVGLLQSVHVRGVRASRRR